VGDMSWFDIVAERKKHTMFFSDQMKEPSGGEDAYFLRFCVMFSRCRLVYNGSYDEISRAFVEAIKSHPIEMEFGCPVDGVHNKTLINLRQSRSSFRIAMSHQDYIVFLSMLNNPDQGLKIELSIPDPYPDRISSETLLRASELLEGRAQDAVHPHDNVDIKLVGFSILFED
jgi:hypothetical protein